VRSLRVGYFEGKEEKDRPELAVLRDLGVKLVPVKLPDKLPVRALRIILTTEAAAVFDELTRQGVKEGLNTWPRTFQAGQFVPAIEYLRANRLRTLLMREMDEAMAPVDAYVGGDDLLITNLTGHPTVILPNGLAKRGDVETPTTVTFTGKLYGETELLALGHAYQLATGHHLRHPAMEKLTKENAEGVRPK
jgi:Asp-tRNA(Asn)/Glu-tRNA(Gln) amidotransferase A subunit family amidase